MRRRLAMAEALEGSRPDWSLGVVTFDENHISNLSPAQAKAAGRDVDQALVQADGVPDAEVIARLVESQDDPYFADEFARALSGQELAEVIVGLSGLWDIGMAGGADDSDSGEAWFPQMVDALGATMGTATRSTGDLLLPEDYAESWVKAITQDSWAHGEGVLSTANALELLLYRGRFGAPLLVSLASGVFEHEYEATPSGGPWDPVRQQKSYPGVPRVLGEFGDPMAGIMAALSENPQAAHQFFSTGPRMSVELAGEQVEVSQRLQYFSQVRQWESDPTAGGAYGAALEAASLTFREHSTKGRVSAEIAAQAIALMGEPLNGEWEMPRGLRPHMARVVASYALDVRRVTTRRSDNLTNGWIVTDYGDDLPSGMPPGAALNVRHLTSVVAVLGEESEDMAVVIAGMLQANTVALDHALRLAKELGGDAATLALLEGRNVRPSSWEMEASGEFLGWALRTGYGGDKASEAVIEKKVAATANALSLAGAMPFVPDVEPDWLRRAVDSGTEMAQAELKDRTPQEADPAYFALERRVLRVFEVSTINLLLQAGYFDGPLPVNDYPPPADAFVRPEEGGDVYFLVDSAEFDNWYVESPAASLVSQRVVGTYKDQWSVIDNASENAIDQTWSSLEEADSAES